MINSMNVEKIFFATCPKGIESLLADELRGFGAEGVKETRKLMVKLGILKK